MTQVLLWETVMILEAHESQAHSYRDKLHSL